MRSSSSACVALRFGRKPKLEYRFEHELRRHLHDAILHRRYAQRTLLAVRLRDVHAPHRSRAVPLLSQLALDFRKEVQSAALLDHR
jgi:hypothetical protein